MFGAPIKLGQQVVYGKPAHQYSNTSEFAQPYPTEDELLATGQTQPIGYSMDKRYLGSYGTVPPPAIPYIDEEKERLLAEQNRILWPKEAGTYNYPLGQEGESPSFLKDPPGWLMNWITPENAWGWILSGSVLIALSQTKKLKYTIASPVLAGGGGVILGIGVIPFILKYTAKAKAAKEAKEK